MDIYIYRYSFAPGFCLRHRRCTCQAKRTVLLCHCTDASDAQGTEVSGVLGVLWGKGIDVAKINQKLPNLSF